MSHNCMMSFSRSRKIVLLLGVLSFLGSCSYSRAKKDVASDLSGHWSKSFNLTPSIDSLGVAELSGLHWNSQKKQLFAVSDNGYLYVLQQGASGKGFSLTGSLKKIGNPEGITTIDEAKNEFYTIDEKHFEIRKYSYSPDFSSYTLMHKWNLLSDQGGMVDTGNDGPEGIEFIPDSYLSAAGFETSDTEELYTSKKGMGGLIFIAHQKRGLIWVYDVNPDQDNDLVLVGRYKTSQRESCDLSFDRSTGLLYILHNTDGNFLEVTDLSLKKHGGKRKFNTIAEYPVPNPGGGSANIEGFAITPKFDDPKQVSAWFCKDISNDEPLEDQKDCLRWFTHIQSDGNRFKNTVK